MKDFLTTLRLETKAIPVDPIKQIQSLHAAMLAGMAEGTIEERDPPVDHLFAHGLYARRVYVPAGTTVITKVHLKQHITVALKGHCTMMDEQGRRSEVQAPGMWVTEPGTYRAIYCHDDTEWITINAVESPEQEKAELETLAEDYDDYRARTENNKPKCIDANKFKRINYNG